MGLAHHLPASKYDGTPCSLSYQTLKQTEYRNSMVRRTPLDKKWLLIGKTVVSAVRRLGANHSHKKVRMLGGRGAEDCNAVTGSPALGRACIKSLSWLVCF